MFQDTAQLLVAPRWLLELIATSTRITVLLGVAGLAAYALRRAPAHARHLVWTVALAGSLLLPFAEHVLPTVTVPILPRPSPSPVIDWTDELPGDSHLALGRADSEPEVRLTSAHGAPVEVAAPLTLDRWLLAVWLSGIAVVLLKLLFDRARVWYLSDHSKDVSGERLALFQRQVRRLGIERRVRLVELDDTRLPMTWGIFTPTVALPAASRAWSGARLEAVLLHELAHVRRHDAATQLLAQLACAAFWVHPFVWWAAREMRVLREYACDDEVLAQGVRPSSYAEEILGIVRGLRPEGFESGATMAMARPSELKARIVALLDPRVPHQRLDRTRQLTIGASALGLALSLASVQPAAAEPPPAPPLPRLKPDEAARRQAEKTPATPPAAATAPAKAATATPPPAPSAPPAPLSVAPPPTAPEAPPAAPARAKDEGTCDEAPQAKVDGEAKRRLQALAEKSLKDADLAEQLEEIANDEALESENTRQQYLALARRVTDEQARLESLESLLRGAPTSEETGRAVLEIAGHFKDEGPRAETLAAMHQIRERGLVRGPLALAYLDVASQLKTPAALADALRELLHPSQVRGEAVERALELAEPLDGDLLREVLLEVTDHQRITPAVEARYQRLTARLTGDAKEDVEQRLAEAKASHGRSATRGWVWASRAENLQATAFKEQEAQLREQARRLEEQASRLKEQAARLKEQAKERSKQLKERLKALGKSGSSGKLELDIDQPEE